MLSPNWPKRSAYFSFAKITMISTAVIIAGCQRIPDQERVTKLSVSDIVRNIRCEIQEALVEKDVDGRKIYPDKIVRNDGKLTENWIYKAAVSYTFEFKTEINNNLDLSFNGIWNIPRRIGRRASEKLTSNNSGDFDKKRKGENLWTASESLGKLKDADCSSVNYRRSFRYPIKGKLDLYKILEDYYEIGNNPFLTTTNYQRFLEFTVLKGGTINPIYFISPVPLDRRTFTSSLSWRADRQDIHSVTISFSLAARWQYLANRVEEEEEKDPEVMWVRIVGGVKKDKKGKPIPSKDCEIKNGKRICKPKIYPSEIKILSPGDMKWFKAADTADPAEPFFAPATKVQDDSRGLSTDEIRRLEQKQYNERSIRADESRIR